MALNYFAFQSAQTKLENLSIAFRDAIKRVVNVENAQFNAVINKFDSSINSIIINNTIGEEISALFVEFNKVSDSPNDQYLLFKEMFDFGDTDTTALVTQVQLQNNRSINLTVKIQALAYAYVSACEIEYGNQQELDSNIKDLELQYQSIITGELELDSDTRIALINQRTRAFQFFGSLDLSAIIETETKMVPSTVLAYRLYEDSTRSDEIVTLNRIQDTGYIEGTINILSTDDINT